VPYLPRLRALALFGRWSVERAELLSCRRPKTLYGASAVGWVQRALPSILGMKAPLLGRAERSIPAARKGRAFGRAGLTAKARAER
jgi:hypothetical protein